MSEVIGRVAATEKFPATMDKFYFWTDADFRLNAFDVVKVEHIEGSYTFGTVENIFHITDAKSFLTNYISCDFGDTTVVAPTLRIGMNYVEVSVSFNTKNIYTPVKNDSPVSLADTIEIEQALGLDKIKNKSLVINFAVNKAVNVDFVRLVMFQSVFDLFKGEGFIKFFALLFCAGQGGADLLVKIIFVATA